MLCSKCASIDLSEALGPIPDDSSLPLHEAWGDISHILHYESYAGMIAAAVSCQLCALVVKAFDAPRMVRPHPKQAIYRFVEREKIEEHVFAGDGRRIIKMMVGVKGHKDIFKQCQVELFVGEDTKLAESNDFVWRPIRDAEDGALPLNWLKQCNRDHLKCRTETNSTFKPTRLLDVGSTALPELRLQDGTQCSGPYATLSYCWGKKSQNRTTKSTLKASMIGLDISTLCKTMHDAVITTRNLQIQYLWIDALCIIQDDPLDWEREALSMSEVYAQSAITIAATSSSDSDGGLFFRRPPAPTAQLLWTFSDGSPPERVNFRSSGGTSRKTSLHENSPLHKRGWVLQERLLSKRTLHFATDRLYWDCQEVAVEEGTTRCYMRDSFNEYAPQVASRRIASAGPRAQWALYEVWVKTVQDYTRMHLTYRTDRLPALAGLAKIYAQASNDRYIAGCWQKNLHLYLLWRSELPLTNSSAPLQPSWSWVSYDGPVSFLKPHPDPTTYMSSLINNIAITIDGSSTCVNYGQIREGVLELTGRVKYAIFSGKRTPADNEFLQDMPWIMKLGERECWYNRAAFDKAPKLGEVVLMLRVCGKENEWGWTEYVILLEPVKGKGCFKRVGMGETVWDKRREGEEGPGSENVLRESWFDDVPDVRVKIY